MRRIVTLTLATTVAVARADPPEDPPIVSSEEPRRVPREPVPEPAPVPQAPEPTARDTTRAPPPGEESGRIDSGEPGDSTGRVIARAALFVPKWLFAVVMWPPGAALQAEDENQLSDWYYRLLYYRNRTIGIEPVLAYETGFGLTGGVRVFDKDTFGEREHGEVQATAGTEYRVTLLASIDSGRRLGPVKIGAAGNFDRRPAEPFYGIGNEDDVVGPTGTLIDPTIDATAVGTHFRYQEIRGGGFVDVALVDHLFASARGWYAELEYTPSKTEPSIETVYDPANLVGFDETTKHLYGEAELRYDSRRIDSPWDALTVHANGSLARAFAGYSHQLDGISDFWHYGAELQHYWRLGYGPRVLALRFHGEGVTGPLDQVPITELPYLGGGVFLRGFPYARFRDRIATVGSVQYMWSLSQFTSAFLFTDVGRVYRDWSDFTLRDMHAGFGIGLELYTRHSFLADLSIASSTDGGIALMAEFSPVLDARPRWR